MYNYLEYRAAQRRKRKAAKIMLVIVFMAFIAIVIIAMNKQAEAQLKAVQEQSERYTVVCDITGECNFKD